MKIGRNERCPCGSGLKYKRCCVIKESVFKTFEDEVAFEGDFLPGARKKAEQLKNIITQYDFEDAATAAYCISSWRDNRSALESCIAFNICLINNEFGSLRIKTFDDFIAFFNSIKEIMQPFEFTDYVHGDFGEVQIKYNGINYPVILGTGHEQVYGALHFMLGLVDRLDKRLDLLTLLDYTKFAIDYLAPVNEQLHPYEIGFYLPSEAHWNATFSLFSNQEFISLICDASVLFPFENKVERTHFVNKLTKTLPLFNSSVLIDYYHLLLSSASDEEKNNNVQDVLFRSLYSVFDLWSGGERKLKVLFPVCLLDGSNRDNKPMFEQIFTFAAPAKEKIIVALNKDMLTPVELDERMTKITELNSEGNLAFVELRTNVENMSRRALQLANVPGEYKIEVQLVEYSSYTDVSVTNMQFGKKEKNMFTCTALDLFYIINFMDDFDDLCDFIDYEYSEKGKILSLGGNADIFVAWKENGKAFSKGAVEFGMINLGHGWADQYVRDFIADKSRYYPFYSHSHAFINPFSWRFGDECFGFISLYSKSLDSLKGFVTMLDNNICIYLQHNIDFYNMDGKDISFEMTLLRALDELTMRLFIRYKSLFENIPQLNGMIVQLMYMPWDYAQTIDNTGFLTSDSSYCFSDMLIDEELIMLRYSVDAEKFMNALVGCSDKTVECQYFVELIEQLCKSFNAHNIIAAIQADAHNKKDVNVFEDTIEFMYSPLSRYPSIEQRYFEPVRKRIAIVCQANDISPGTYKGKDAHNVIRTMQVALVSDFESRVIIYDKLVLHEHLLSFYSACLGEGLIDLRRFKTLSNLDDMVKKENYMKIVKSRERSRRDASTLLYIIETNLFLERTSDIDKISRDSIFELIAYADWLETLQNMADICYRDDDIVEIEITPEYLVNTNETEKSMDYQDELQLRKYKTIEYSPTIDDEDEKLIKEAVDAFEVDTGVDFKQMLDFLDYVMRDVCHLECCVESHPNVYRINVEELKKSYVSDFDTPLSKDIADKIVQFLTVTTSSLKTLKNKIEPILPTWDRKNRDMRFEVKPFFEIDTDIIFSPVALNDTSTKWKLGMQNWFPPYEIGLPTFVQALAKWKRRHESLMVCKLAEMFNQIEGLCVIPELQLHKRFKKDGYPPELGDYDIFAIDSVRRKIWMIEAKVLSKVGSVFESQQQQYNFFHSKKFDEKFQKRIDYARENTAKILGSFNMNNEVEYELCPYMVTNKLLLPMHKVLAFPVLVYSEMRDVLHNVYGDIIDIEKL